MAYPGGKSGSGVYQQIINQIPPHDVYVELFLGAGAVMRFKRPAECSIGIDADGDVVADWNEFGENIPPGGTVRRGDAISFLMSYDWQGGEFVYLDPPYLFDTRAGRKRIYTCEFGTIAEHVELLRLILELPCMVAISGYYSSLYMDMLATWRMVSYQTRTRGGSTVREWLWMNYPAPVELHDYRYLGDNFRERERIKRIRSRWLARLVRMDDLERYAVLSSIAEYSDRIRKVPSSASPD